MTEFIQLYGKQGGTSNNNKGYTSCTKTFQGLRDIYKQLCKSSNISVIEIELGTWLLRILPIT